MFRNICEVAPLYSESTEQIGCTIFEAVADEHGTVILFCNRFEYCLVIFKSGQPGRKMLPPYLLLWTFLKIKKMSAKRSRTTTGNPSFKISKRIQICFCLYYRTCWSVSSHVVPPLPISPFYIKLICLFLVSCYMLIYIFASIFYFIFFSCLVPK